MNESYKDIDRNWSWCRKHSENYQTFKRLWLVFVAWSKVRQLTLIEVSTPGTMGFQDLLHIRKAERSLWVLKVEIDPNRPSLYHLFLFFRLKHEIICIGKDISRYPLVFLNLSFSKTKNCTILSQVYLYLERFCFEDIVGNR